GEEEQDRRDFPQRRGRGGRACSQPRLDVPDDIVSEVPGETAAEARQVGNGGGAVPALKRGDEIERIALVPFGNDAAVIDLDRPPARSQSRRRRQADERVATEALAAHD